MQNIKNQKQTVMGELKA